MKKLLSALALLVTLSLAWLGYNVIEAGDALTKTNPTAAVIDLAFQDEVTIGNGELNPADQYLRATPDGRVFVSWTEDSGGVRARNAFMSALNSDGSLASEGRRINDVPGEVHWYGGDNRLKFTVDPEGGITAVYASPLAEFKTGIVKTAHAEKGGDFMPSVQLNDDEVGEVPVAHAFATIASSPNGKIYAAWIDSRNRQFLGMAKSESPAERRKDIKMRDLTIPDSIMKLGPQKRAKFAEANSQLFMAVSEDGGKTFGTNYPITTEIKVCACCVPTIAFLDGGDTVVVSYRYVTDDFLRDNVTIRSTDGGKTFSEPTYISVDGWYATFCPHAGSSLISDNSNRLHSLWFTAGPQDVDEAGIYYSSSDDAGETFAPRELIDKTPKHTVLHTKIVADANDGLWAVWENFIEEDMKPQIFLAYRAAGDDTWTNAYQLSDGTKTSMLPSLATDGQTIYIAWTEKTGEISTVKVRTASLVGS